MSWPTPQDYNEAIQNPHLSFEDESLSCGTAQLNALGLPQPASGNFASVYRVHSKNKDWAVRCFLRQSSDQPMRYERLADFICHDNLPYTVDFHYAPKGIRVQGQWYPILKMEWVEGVTLDRYIQDNWKDSEMINCLAEEFKLMTHELRKAGVAHGDLQHGNIMVYEQKLRLVDYDDFYVPSLAGFSSNAIGHRNYQHPSRSPNDFDTYIDNFSAWIIYASLKTLSIDPDLCVRLSDWDDCLLFRQGDFLKPTQSATLSFCMLHENGTIRNLAAQIKQNLATAPRELPFLPEGQNLTETFESKPIATSGSSSLSQAEFQSKDKPQRILARFADPSFAEPIPEVKIFESSSPESENPNEDLEFERIKKAVEFTITASEYHLEALTDGSLAVEAFAETIQEGLEARLGRKISFSQIVDATNLFSYSLKRARLHSPTGLPGSIAKNTIAKFRAEDSFYPFSDQSLAVRFKQKRDIAAAQLVLPALWMALFLSLHPLILFIFLGLLLNYTIAPFLKIKSNFQRYASLITNLDPIPATVEISRTGTALFLPSTVKMNIIAGGGRNSWGKTWTIDNPEFANKYPNLVYGKQNLDLYFDPMDGRPIAIYTGARVFWLV